MRRLEALSAAAGRLRRAVLDKPAMTSITDRRAAYDERVQDETVNAFVTKVRNHAYRVLDSDIDALRQRGLSDDAIFELTVAAALGEADRRLSAGARLLGL